MINELPTNWAAPLAPVVQSDAFHALADFVSTERKNETIYPPEDKVFAAFETTPFDDVKVLLLGQDPYHGPDQAHGLCFSVPHGIKPPPSLANMMKELATDLGIEKPNHGNLLSWAQQGVLLLNTVLTVRAGNANSHQKQGWEKFTDQVIKAMNDRAKPVVFVFWGNSAKKKKKLVTHSRHVIIEGAHPSPLSAYRGFFGSRPYSKINDALQSLGYSPINWELPVE